MSSHLPNYVRAQRKRLGLSQADVAVLLGAESGAKVCRYERFAREPSLRTALACEALFQTSVSELFAGLYEVAEREVARRAKVLCRQTAKLKPTRENLRKQALLATIAACGTHQPQHS